MSGYIHILDDIGFFAPMILFTFSIILLWSRIKYLNVYLIFFLLNMLLNKTLKQLIGEPRPGEATEKNVYKGYENTKGAEIYGMPSGHAQSVLFSTIYTYLVTKTESVLIGGGFISMLSLIQRYKFKRHSIKQLIVGSLLGAGVALFGYNISTFYLTCK